jgi:hypothetical protein
MAELAAKKAALDRQLADPATYAARSGAVQDLLREQASLAQLLAEAETQWLAAAEALEQEEG